MQGVEDISAFFEELAMQEEQWIVVVQHDDEKIEFARELGNGDIRELVTRGLSPTSSASFVIWHS